MAEKYMHIRGLRAPVRLRGEGWQIEEFAGFFPLDYVSFSQDSPGPSFAVLYEEKGRYLFFSDFTDEPVVHRSKVNAICDLIATISRQRAVELPHDLCLHASAVLIGGQLAVFPALRRAGKSVLTAALAARGHKVFSDDVLFVRARPGEKIVGQAFGTSIRLRLPLPNSLPDWVTDHIETNAGPENDQYQYLPSPNIEKHGTKAEIGALIGLERIDSGRSALVPMSRGAMLKSLLHQNFARAASARHILSVLLQIAKGVPAYKLTYASLDDAIELLEHEIPPLAKTELTAPVATADVEQLHQWPFDSDLPVSRHAGAEVFQLDTEYFATSSDQTRIIHMDEGAIRIWNLLSEPTSQKESIEILSTAFPDADSKQIAAETAAIFREFHSAGLITPYE